MACTFGEALVKYELYARARGFTAATLAHARDCVTLFDGFLGGGRDVGDVTADDFRRFLADLRQRPARRGVRSGDARLLSGTSVNTYARAVKAFFSWLQADAIIAANPLASEPAPKKPRTIPKVYSDRDLKAVLEVVMPDLRNKAVFYSFLDTGLRLTELSQLTVKTADTRAGSVTVMGKGGIERQVALTPLPAAAVDDYVKNGRPTPRNTERLFLTANGRPLSASGMQSMLERVGKEAGLKERLSPHKLRHTFATRALKYGGNLEYIRKVLGHSDIKTTSNAYLNADYTDIKAAHEKFSPLSNLMQAFGGAAPDTQQGRKRGDSVDRPEGSPGPGTPEGTAPGRAQSSVKEQESTPGDETSGGAPGHEGAGESPGRAGDGLKPICRDLYREHLRKLAVLAGELASDIENGHLEPQRHAAKTSAGGAFAGLDLARVYHAQNSRLWPYLSQHLDNEMTVPKLSKQIRQVAVDALVKRVLEKKPGEREPAESVRATLVLMSERGTFEGTCEICRAYFYEAVSSSP